MAIIQITKLKTGLSKLIDYAMNPAKTTVEETVNGEKALLVSGINCTPQYAKKQIKETRERFNKSGGNIAYHIIQSFDDNEGTPEMIHNIGIQFAERMFGDRFEVIVATHQNTNNLHNHIVLSAVSFVDGKKFNDCKSTMYRMREVSDELCKEFNLSVIKNPKSSSKKNYALYQAEQNGIFTVDKIIQKDIDECILRATSQRGFYYEMRRLGYDFDFNKKYPTISHPHMHSKRRFYSLGDEYTPERINERIRQSWKKYEIILPEQDEYNFYSIRYARTFTEVYVRFVTIVRGVKERPKENRKYNKYFAEEVRKFNRLIEEQNLLLDNDIESREQLIAFQKELFEELPQVIEARNKLRNELRRAERADNREEIIRLRSDIRLLTGRAELLRKRIKICDRILEQEPKIRERAEYIISENEKELRQAQREKYRSRER